jgi:hypothetical protein
MNNLLNQVGYCCQKGNKIQVLKSNAGYYIGTLDEDECPNCRISQYAKKPDDPILNIERECMENQYCNGHSLSGCTISASKTLKHNVSVGR